MVPKILRIMLFRDPKGKSLQRVPHILALKPGSGVLKSPDFSPRPKRVFAGRSGGTATCEHSHELTTELLGFKATGVFTAFMPSTAV